MKQLRRGWRRLFGSLSSRSAESELAEEISSHIEMQIEDNLRLGMSETEARRAARLKFGGVESAKEGIRDQRGLPLLDALSADFRYALRSLRKDPGFTLVVVLTLAVGIGVNTTVFSLVDQVLLRPSGIKNPERVITVKTAYRKVNVEFLGGSFMTFADMRNSRHIFERVALVSGADVNYTGGLTPQRLRGAAVSSEWFDVFGAKPYMGRVFSVEEDQPNTNRVVVLSFAAWKQWFGGDPGILGRSIELNQTRVEVIGVMAPGFRVPEVDLWSPRGLAPADLTEQQRFNESSEVYARIRDDITVLQATEYMKVLTNRVRKNPETAKIANESNWSITAIPFIDAAAGDNKASLLALLAAVGLILLIACTNIAGLLVARASSRAREFAVRAALGANARQLLSGVLAESLLLAALGGSAGIAVALGGMQLLLSVTPENVITGLEPRLDLRIFLFCAGVAVLSAFLFGVIPAWQVFRLGTKGALSGEGRATTAGSGRQRTRSLLVVAETALALVLLITSGLFLRSFTRLQEVNPGFDPSHVMTATFSLPIQSYPRGGTERKVFYRSLLDRLRATPGITYAALTSAAPFVGGNNAGNFEIVGRVLKPGEVSPHANERGVTPEFFATMGIPLKRGRFLTEEDQASPTGEHALVIDEELANEYWPGEDPIGRQVVRIFHYRIVGVVGHVLHFGLNNEQKKGVLYYSAYERGIAQGQIVVKTTGDPNRTASAIRLAVQHADPRLAVDRFLSLEDAVSRSLAPRRFGMQLIAVFAVVGLFLAALGLYGVMSYQVAQRTREIGIRMALGAAGSQVLGMIVGQGMRLTAIGGLIGLAAAAASGWWIESQLYGITAYDPTTLVTTTVILVIAAILASYIPAQRAVRIDPAVALRPE